jgi:MFS family permease
VATDRHSEGRRADRTEWERNSSQSRRRRKKPLQILDGVGAGIFGALFFIVIADLTKGTGHYNLAQGASSASWGLGAALSNGVAGFIVNSFGYSAAFLFLAACAILAFLVFWFGVPETRNAEAARFADESVERLASPELSRS